MNSPMFFNTLSRKTALVSGVLCSAMLAAFIIVVCSSDTSAWTMKKAPIMTKWSMIGTTPQINPAQVWTKYPRMQMRRPAAWQNLNGIWQFQKGTGATEALPAGTLTGDILVPFPIESAISGIMDNNIAYAWYRKVITIPPAWAGQKVLVHFEGVDYKTEIYINGKVVAQHLGGYDRFTADVTRFLHWTSDTLTVHIWDPTENSAGYNPNGKQRKAAGGIFYTAATGIWRNVWMEAVSSTAYINNLKITPDVDNHSVKVTVTVTGDSAGLKIYAFAKDKQRGMWGADSATSTTYSTNLTVKLSAVNLWWPDRPFLYDLGIYIKKNGQFVDSVQSYFGMRKVTSTAFSNKKRITINGQSIFLFGTLDQGFWCDGIYTAPSEEALKYDLEMHKAYGMNGLRKHVKVEPDYWFWLCDSMGLLVEQDMPSIASAPTAEGQTNFNREIDSLVVQHYNHPCIVMWIPYNESWGEPNQAGVTATVNRIMARDSTRLVNCASGWNFYPVGHVKDVHSYPQPANPAADPAWILMDGEYGGIRLNTTELDAHEWSPNNSWGYADQTSQAGYETTFKSYCQSLATYKNGAGVSCGIYTQITDCETECNGLLTYDRALSKGRPDQIKAACDLIVDHPASAAIVNPTAAIPAAFFGGVSIGFNRHLSTSAASTLRVTSAWSSGGALTVALAGKGAAALRIVNAQGRMVFATAVSNPKAVSVPAGSIAKGVYFVELNNGTEKQTMRCVVR